MYICKMDEKTQKFYEEYILTNQNYVNKELYPLENIKGAHSKILLSTKYGNIKINPNNIKYNNDFSIITAIDKTEYFKRLLEEVNPIAFQKLILKSNYEGYKEDMFFETKYGLIKTKADLLFSGRVPNIKSAVNKTEYWINQAIEVHGDKYDYSLVEYINNSTKVKIIYKKHGIFMQTPTAHVDIKKAGCPECGRKVLERLEKNKKEYINIPAKLYILELKNEKESFFKIGVTKIKINRRASHIKPYKHTLLKAFDLNLYDAGLKEYEWLETLKQYQYTPKHKFKGYTECFSINPLEKLKIDLTEL